MCSDLFWLRNIGGSNINIFMVISRLNYIIHEPIPYSSCFFLFLCLVENKCWGRKKPPIFPFGLEYSNDVNGFYTMRYFFFFVWFSFSFDRDCTKKTMRRQRQRVWITVRPLNTNSILCWRTSVRFERLWSPLGFEDFPTVWPITVNLSYICFLFQAKYKDSYVQNVLGHYIGSFEDPYQIHCMKVSAQNSDVSLKTIAHVSQWRCLGTMRIIIYFCSFSL